MRKIALIWMLIQIATFLYGCESSVHIDDYSEPSPEFIMTTEDQLKHASKTNTQANGECWSLHDFQGIDVGLSTASDIEAAYPGSVALQMGRGLLYVFPLSDGRYISFLCSPEYVTEIILEN